MSEVERLRRAVYAQEHDPILRLVYADALEEAGCEEEARVNRVRASLWAGKDKSFERFHKAYVECALWCGFTDERERRDWEASDIDEDSRRRMRADCISFFLAAGVEEECSVAVEEGNFPSYVEAFTTAGHDFFLTRNREGAGFWDGNWPELREEAGRRLTAHARTCGEACLEVQDDRIVYLT